MAGRWSGLGRAWGMAWALAGALALAGCGGSSGGGIAGVVVSGASVKGPMANADATVYAFDPTAPGFKGAVIATATTNGAAALTGLSMVPPFDPFYIVEYTANAGTTDLSTGAAPVLPTLRTILTSADISGDTPVYATPQGTVAVDLAGMNADSNVPPYTGNNDGTVTAQEFQNALGVAAAQVASTIGFGMTGTDLFTTPPLLTDDTDTPEAQATVAAYRTAVEGLTAILADMLVGKTASYTDMLDALTQDLADGVIDGQSGTTPVPLMDAAARTALTQDPTGLTIPGTSTTVGDVEDLLKAETADTGVTVDTSGLSSGTADPQPAQTDSDSDDDGALNVQDNCPDVANADQANADGDGAGDACDVCPDDADDDADADLICAGTGFASPATGDGDNCPDVANADQADADSDGAGDACDFCPDDGDNDADGDGICNGAGFVAPATGGNDNCPDVANADQTDTDDDGTGDACDVCPDDTDNDADGDGVCNGAGFNAPATGGNDNCPAVANADQANADGDGAGDACDVCPGDPDDDADGDGICAGTGFNDPKTGDGDNCPAVSNVDQANADGDALGDACDVCPADTDNDSDGDGICVGADFQSPATGGDDNCPADANTDQADTDEDGAGDACDVCPNDPEDLCAGGNTPPVVGADEEYTGVHGSSFNFFVNPASDADDDALTYIVVTPPTHAANFQAFNDTIGFQSFLYASDVAYVGPDSFTYKVYDGTADSASVATVSFTMTNQTPQVGPDDSFFVTPSVDLMARVSAASDPDAVDTLTYEVVTAPTHGTVLAGSFDPETDRRGFTYEPASGFTGTDSFTYRVNDGAAVSPTTATVTLAVGSEIERVSTTSEGGETTGGGWEPAVSADGRFVAFGSEQRFLDPNDEQPFEDVFVKDRQTGVTELVSRATGANGAIGDDYSYYAAISADGRYVLFSSDSTNLVPDDTNDAEDVFVRDRQTGTTERVSVSSAEEEGDAWSEGFDISADGRYVTFASAATHLVDGDTNGSDDVFVRDRVLGTTERVSVATGGGQAADDSWWATISDDGRYVAFGSVAANLAPGGDTNGVWDIFVRDRVDDTTELISATGAGVPGNDHCGIPNISADGHFVAFDSYADNLVANDTNEVQDVFVRDRETGATTRVSRSSAGTQGNGDAYWATLSADGRYVVFQSEADNLAPGDTNGTTDVFLHDRQIGATYLVSLAGGQSGDDHTGWPGISADGRVISFEGTAGNLVAGDTNGTWDAFVATNPGAPFDPGADDDGDGLTNGDELTTYFTFYFLADSDGDGVNDGDEVDTGTDPLDPEDF